MLLLEFICQEGCGIVLLAQNIAERSTSRIRGKPVESQDAKFKEIR